MARLSRHKRSVATICAKPSGRNGRTTSSGAMRSNELRQSVDDPWRGRDCALRWIGYVEGRAAVHGDRARLQWWGDDSNVSDATDRDRNRQVDVDAPKGGAMIKKQRATEERRDVRHDQRQQPHALS